MHSQLEKLLSYRTAKCAYSVRKFMLRGSQLVVGLALLADVVLPYHDPPGTINM